jgi:hypothetical protein
MTSLRSTILTLLATVFIACVASACSTTDPGKAIPESTIGTGSESTPTQSNAATSGSQLDITKFKASPCDLLQPAQLATLGPLDAPKSADHVLGPGCTWHPVDATKGTTYAVTLVTNGSTIESMTETAKSRPVFRKTKIEGLAAVSSDGTNGQGDCATSVGTSSKDAILVQISTSNTAAPEYKDSCGTSEKIAALVILNLRG